MMTRRHFLSAAAGTLAVRTMRGQTLQPVPIPGLEAGELTRSLALRNVTVKRAELLLLDANPLVDIANTAKINMVFTSGRVYRRPALDAMLNAVETNARNAFTPSQD